MTGAVTTRRNPDTTTSNARLAIQLVRSVTGGPKLVTG